MYGICVQKIFELKKIITINRKKYISLAHICQLICNRVVMYGICAMKVFALRKLINNNNNK